MDRRKERWSRWRKTHTVNRTVYLNVEKDADILSWIEGKTFTTEVKRLIRESIAKGSTRSTTGG